MKLKTSAILMLMTAASCSKKSSDDAPAAAANKTTELANPSSLIFAINGALSSVPQSSLSLATTMSGNPLCTEHGMPVKDGVTTAKGEVSVDADRMASSDADYASRFFMCLATLSAKDGASVETIQGALSQVASVMCTFEKALGTITYTTEGTNLVPNGAVTASMDSTCWPNGTPEGMTSVTLDSGTATLLDESTGFEKELKFTSESAGVDYRLRFFNKDGVIGFRTIDSGISPGIGGYSEIVLDSKEGVILVDVVDDRNGSGGADSAFRRTNRMLVKGTIDTSTLKFTALTAMQGIRAESGNYASNPDVFSGTTMIGTVADGFYGTSVNYDGTSFTTNYAGCTGAKTTCPSSGLVFSDATFYSNRTVWEAHKIGGKPICYNGSDIGFGTLATGAYGKCD
jgi:hypothetical protein